MKERFVDGGVRRGVGQGALRVGQTSDHAKALDLPALGIAGGRRLDGFPVDEYAI
jgi:hypothetical protein